MTLVRCNPRGRQLAGMHDSLDDMLRDFFVGPYSAGTTVAAGWSPATDVVEEPAKYVVTLDLPGMKREEIKISVENDTLAIQGERKREVESSEQGYSRYERAYGSFKRTFSLPKTIDGNRIEASYKDGILTVTLPKSEEARPKSIEVRVN